MALPPLRERTEDIVNLALDFIKKLSARLGRALLDLSPRAVERLLHHTWPGNVRELYYVIEKAVALTQSGPVPGGAVLLPAGPVAIAATRNVPPEPEKRLPYGSARAHFEGSYWRAVLEAAGWNVRRAAALARVSERLVYQRIRGLGLRKDPRS